MGLAPGLRGANRTGRPFTGDYAGELLYGTLLKFGFATGAYAADPNDGLTLVDAAITNAVRCVPPQNKPTPAETRTCRAFLQRTIAAHVELRAVVALGRVAHDAVVRSMQLAPSRFAFAHGAVHDCVDAVRLYDSYHCSRYNTNTRRLTAEMFEAVFAQVRADLSESTSAAAEPSTPSP